MWRQKSSAFVVIHRYYKNHHHIPVVVVIKLTIIVTKSASTTSTPPPKTILPPSLLIAAAKHHSLPYIHISFWKNPPLKKVFSLAKISKERERESWCGGIWGVLSEWIVCSPTRCLLPSYPPRTSTTLFTFETNHWHNCHHPSASMEQPSILVRILHSIPHVNYTFQRVNDTFNPDSDVYLEVSLFL